MVLGILKLIRYTKMGYAGNFEPDYIIPTAIADVFKKVNTNNKDKYFPI